MAETSVPALPSHKRPLRREQRKAFMAQTPHTPSLPEFTVYVVDHKTTRSLNVPGQLILRSQLLIDDAGSL